VIGELDGALRLDQLTCSDESPAVTVGGDGVPGRPKFAVEDCDTTVEADPPLRVAVTERL